MDRRRMRKWKRSISWAWESVGPLPGNRAWIAGGAIALVLLFGLGVWSCQTSPGRRIATTPSLAGEPEVRIRIRQGVERTRIEGTPQLAVRLLTGGSAARNLPGPLVFTSLEDGMRITDGREAHWSYDAAVEITPMGGATLEPTLLRVDDVPYAGRIRVHPRGARSGEGGTAARPHRLDVVEVVPMETYIAGVTVSELYRSWGLGAFQVQSVAARTYAMQQRQRARELARDYDLESTVLDQAYGGWTDHAVANQAAASTRGMVLKWQGRLLRAYYSSTCGGRPAGAAEIWPTTRGFEFNLDGPIQAHEREHLCQASPVYRWEVVRDRAELSTRMREWGRRNGSDIRRIGQVQSVHIAERNSTGRPVQYTVRDDRGQQFQLNAEHLRNACNTGAEGLPDIINKTRVRSGDLEMEVQGSRVTIRGRGFGHGVGMCQFCAQGMSQRGDTWREMLLRFYPGARIDRMY